MNDYQQKLAARKERYEALAEKAETEASERFQRADLREEISGIPFGQPILVGHHSEKRHRAAIARADSNMRKGVEASKKAKYYANKAESVGTGGISSDDPEAIQKLKAKIEKAEKNQQFMKDVNKAQRANDTDTLKTLGLTDDQIAKINKPDFAGRTIAFPRYALSNNNANIRRMKDRLEGLEAKANMKPREDLIYDGFKVVQNIQENRIQFIFDGKPDADTRATMKSNGFRWAPSQGAWQRHFNNNGIHAARMVIKKLTKQE